jgi:hypothetical protein
MAETMRPQPGDRIRIIADGQFRSAEGVFVEWGPFAHSVLLDQDAPDGPDSAGVRFFQSHELMWLVPDGHACDNCSGIDPDTCMFNGEKEGS